MTLDAYLKALPGRCDGCGYHPATQGHGDDCAPVRPTEEWPTFVAALRSAAVHGVVHQSAVRPLIRGRIEPKHIGILYRRAKAEELLVEIGHERSDDAPGRNSGRMEPTYRLTAA